MYLRYYILVLPTLIHRLFETVRLNPHDKTKGFQTLCRKVELDIINYPVISTVISTPKIAAV